MVEEFFAILAESWKQLSADGIAHTQAKMKAILLEFICFPLMIQ